MKKQVVITGINGFVGHHLAATLHSHNIEVIGIGRDRSASSQVRGLLSHYYQADLSKEWPEISTADGIIHLAGLAAIGPSFEKPQDYITSNSSMVTHMAENYLGQSKKPRILIVSSGAIYDSHQPLPLTEDSAVGFTSPYAVSKVLVENQAAYYRGRGLDIVIARPLNHIGPGQLDGFIVPDFFKKLQAVTTTEPTTIRVGNIKTRRDYTDVRDVVAAYHLLITAPRLKYNTYNVCSGVSVSGEEILELLKNAAQKPNVTFEIDPALVRPTDAMEIYGDPARLQKELGWHPNVSLTKTIDDFVAYERSK